MAAITVKFNSLWKLYVGMDQAALEAVDIDDALAQVEERFACKFEETLKAKGVKLDRSVLKYSYITVNRKNIKDKVNFRLKEGDVIDLFIAVPGG